MKTLRLLILTVAINVIASSAANAQTTNQSDVCPCDTVDVMYELIYFKSATATINGVPADQVKYIHVNDVIEFELTNNPRKRKRKTHGGLMIYQSNGYFELIDVPRQGKTKVKVSVVVHR